MSAKKPHRILWQVLPQAGVDGWKLVKDGTLVRSFLTQKAAAAEAHRLMEFHWDTEGAPSELQIHAQKTGQIRAKDTFPRSTDPADTPG